jgi:photosystem II stability/assembly factor-like uncharacterized protein
LSGALRGICGTLLVGLAIVPGLVVAGGGATSEHHEPVTALAFDASRHALIKASAGALFRTRSDSGDWQPIALPDLANGRIRAIAVSAGDKPRLYVGGSGLGILRSLDGGRSWVAVNDGLPARDVHALSAHAEQPDTVYAYLAGRGIFRSEDAGAHWRLMDVGPRDGILQLVHSNMPGSMQTGWLFAATAKGVGRSMDCFCGWRDAGALATGIRTVAYDPTQSKRVYAATADAVFVSADGGEHWSPAHAPGRNITVLASASTGLLYAAADEGELFVSGDHGDTWRPFAHDISR